MDRTWSDLKEKLKLFVQEALQTVQSNRQQGNDYTIDIKKEVQFLPTGNQAQEVFVHTPQIYLLVSRLGEKLLLLPSFLPLYQVIESDAVLKNSLLVDAGGNEIANVQDRKSWLTNYVLSGIVTDQLAADENCNTVDETIFSKSFSELKSYVESNEIEYDFSLPISCLKVPGTGFQLEPGVEIASLLPVDKTKLVSDNFSPLFTVNDLFQINAVIKVKGKLPKMAPYGVERFEFESLAKRVLTFAKISGAKDAKGKYVVQQALQRSFMPGGGGRSFSQIYEGNMLFGDVYELDDEKIAEWKERWIKYKALFNGQNTKSELVMGRLLSSPANINAHDRLIDYWIILESIFLQGGQELRYKASLRIAQFLGEDREQRKEIFTKIMKSYDYRSKLVHGSAIPSDIDDICKATQAYLLQCLIKIIDNGAFPTDEELNNLALE